jgi:ferrous iron transport protein B
VALVGNPNTGKTTLFNVLTGYRQRVGNYPGVTVDKKVGRLRGGGAAGPVDLLDLPGTYSLSASSADEAVVLDVLLGRGAGRDAPDAIVCVVDAANLQRNLFFVSQVLEIGRPVVVALNMMDEADRLGVRIDAARLADRISATVIPVSGKRGTGIPELAAAIRTASLAPASNHCAQFPECVCAELIELDRDVRSRSAQGDGETARPILLQTLLDPGGYHEQNLIRRCGRGLAEGLAESRARIAGAGEALTEVEARIRYAWIEGVIKECVTRDAPTGPSRTERADRVLTHPVVGLVIFLGVMAGVFQVIYSGAAPIMDGIEAVCGGIGGWIARLLPAGAIQSLVADGMIAGVGAVLVFLPQILILFLFLAVLEDCGYMARAALLMHRHLRRFGLSGKAFIPLLSSFACAVPGIMATRTIEHPRERLLTIVLAPLMSCSARLPVYVLMIGAFVPPMALVGGVLTLQGVTLLVMYMLGVVAAIGIALCARMIGGRRFAPPFLIELPPYRRPSTRTVLFRMYEQGSAFCVQAGTIIFAVTVVIWALGYYPRPASIAAEFDTQRAAAQSRYDETVSQMPEGDADDDPTLDVAKGTLQAKLADIDHRESGAYLRQSWLGRMGGLIEPVVRPLGWDWRIGTAVIAAFPAREVVIATLGTLYNLGAGADEESSTLRSAMSRSTWPDGRPVYNLPVALSVMVFFALCCQCGATLAVIKRETKSNRWPLLVFFAMTGMAYVAALMTYQIGIRLT